MLANFSKNTQLCWLDLGVRATSRTGSTLHIAHCALHVIFASWRHGHRTIIIVVGIISVAIAANNNNSSWALTFDKWPTAHLTHPPQDELCVSAQSHLTCKRSWNRKTAQSFSKALPYINGRQTLTQIKQIISEIGAVSLRQQHF